MFENLTIDELVFGVKKVDTQGNELPQSTPIIITKGWYTDEKFGVPIVLQNPNTLKNE